MYFSAMSKFFYNNNLINQIKLSSSNEIDNIIQEGESIFEKNPTVGLPQVSKLIDLQISKRQED